MNAQAKFLDTAQINGKPVSFFSPPHDEPDFLWVDVEELAKAFLPCTAARKMIKLSHKFETENRLARHGTRISTITCHAMAQGMCGAIDQALHGYVKSGDEWGGGPSETAYCIAAGQMMANHSPMPISELGRAFHNLGGPFMRDLRGEGTR
ncbi:hypothetical protein [Pararhizobium qamdonense]|uniref:hypothetical protein n=1 Tax=Pararhizobium qamdonense TaxID=3031126 RepID=UPI0023E203C1|nr:hypothetical protein [Pararhizobium qamdonense]